jgi:hypothetical protein
VNYSSRVFIVASISSVKMLLKLVVFSACRLKYPLITFAKLVVFAGTSVAPDKNENPVLQRSNF